MGKEEQTKLIFTAKEAFHKYDHDGNGSLDSQEFAVLMNELCKTLQLPHPTDEELRLAMKQLDVDGNESISFEEFSQWWTDMYATIKEQWSPMTEAISEEAKQMFKHYDGDSSGYLERNEFSQFLTEFCVAVGMQKPSRKQVEDAVKEMDKNGDNKISFEEFNHWWVTQVGNTS